MKFKELASLTKDQLEKKKDELSFELIKLNAQVASGTTPKNPGQIRNLKKSIARINTRLHHE
jgi:large subunit ribosomal protein L29